MNKIFVTLGILLSLCATMCAQEKKIPKDISSDLKFTWDIQGPVCTSDGDTITYLEIATTHKIEAIFFTIEWELKGGKIITTTEKSILRHGSRLWTNDAPEIFNSIGLWYNLYILPAPPVSCWDIQRIRFSGQYLVEKTWNDMGQNLIACHTK